jgi:hypothetical protein
MKGSPTGQYSPPKRKLRGSVYTVAKKSYWPELVGLPGPEARKILKEECPVVMAQIVGLGELITEDYIPERVQIFVDDEGIVTWPPQIG